MTSKQRHKLMRDNNISYECKNCGNTGLWKEKYLSLQIHHVDGNTMNNTIQNLVYLCPNCHSQTNTFNRKKTLDRIVIIQLIKQSASIGEVIKKLNRHPSGHLYRYMEKIIHEENLSMKKYQYQPYNKGKILTHPKIEKSCPVCSKLISGDKQYCNRACFNNSRIKPMDYLKCIESIKNHGWLYTAKQLNISDNGLRHKIRRYIRRTNQDINLKTLSKFWNQNNKKCP